MAELNECRLVFVGPRLGQTAVGDYSETFVEAVRPHFHDVVEVRTGGPGVDTLRDIRAYRRAVAAAVASGPPGRVLAHAECAAGGVGPFWAVAGLDVPVTQTIHDPPQGVWMPARTKFMAENKLFNKLVNHGVHYPLRPVSRWLEGRIDDGRTLFALTETGRKSIADIYPNVRAVRAPYTVADRPAIAPAQERPRAVGFFGLVYRGKGFEQIAKIRELLPADIGIRVAGRGTESLPRSPGIDIVGGVDGPAEDAFFESVRAIVVPYGKRHFYAETYPASAVVAHAMSYCTPVISTDYGSLAELGVAEGVRSVPTASGPLEAVPVELAKAIAEVVDDTALLTELGVNAARTKEASSGANVAARFAQEWSTIMRQAARR